MAGITHEIQNPLNFVINFSKMSSKLVTDLEDIINDNIDAIDEGDAAELRDILADLKENMGKIDEHGERAISIVRNILLYSRGVEDAYVPTDIPHIVKEYVWLAYHSMRANFKGFNVTIHEDYDTSLPQAQVVTQDICRAVLNIMNNACYAVWRKQQALGEEADYQPTIDVAVKAQDASNILITIADNGEGMTAEVQQKLYDEFFTTKPVGHGTGLGMALTRDIIEHKHKGHITFTSQENVGTTFTLSIPIRRQA